MFAAALAALVCAATVSCDSATGSGAGEGGQPASTMTSSAQAAPTASQNGKAGSRNVNYGSLLLEATDLSDDEDTFTVRSTHPVPNGLPGASALFVNVDDTRAISNTIAIYPDAATATSTLQHALQTVDTIITGATPRPVPVGTDGTMVAGTSTDGSKAATLLLFTQGPALVRLEFQSAPGDITTNQFVTKIGKMQQIALRTGLPAEQ